MKNQDKNVSKNPSHPRKTLRQRVADRKAGIKEETYSDPKTVRLKKIATLIAYVMQGVGLIMLMVVTAKFLDSGYKEMNWDHVIIYSFMFIIGRATVMLVNFTRK